MSENDVIKIETIKNVRIRNTHNNVLFPLQDIIQITFRNGNTRVLDSFCKVDMTEVNYMSVETTKKTKVRVIFEEESR